MADYANDHVTGHYLSRSWALLTHDSGWIKPVLVLSLVALVPVIGPIAVLGYALEWARLTAWGVDAAPKQKRVDVGQVLVSGWRGFVVALVWNLVIWLVYATLSLAFGSVPGRNLGTALGVLDVIYVLVCLVAVPVIVVAQVRSAVYQRIGAGLRANRVLQMVARDFGGLMHMLGIELLGWLIELAIGLVFGLVVAAMVIPYVVGLGAASGMLLPGSRALGSYIAGILGSLSVPIVIFVFLMSVVAQVMKLVTATGVALWMRQFDVPRWGKSGDPLPDSRRVVSQVGSQDTSSAGHEVPTDGQGDVTGAAATRTTTTIVRVPGQKPTVETHTEVIGERGVIYQGPSEGEDDSSTGQADSDVKNDEAR